MEASLYIGSWEKKHLLVEDNPHHMKATLEWPWRGTSSRSFLLPVGKLRLGERMWTGLGHTVSGRARLTPDRHFFLHLNLLDGQQ